uniref:EH domain-containing protein n=1 Tax=Tanacetum cinerariifolium TaxID=118510 RepID=A0A699GMS6_TANCI|nr:hypothetical protein [Tanacetum cinerariifolium]
MVAILEKGEFNTDFHPMVDFIAASPLRGTIDQTLFIKRNRGDFILVQVYVDDIIFGSSNPQLCKEFEALMNEKFQMSAMGKLNFFLGLQVLQKEDDIFLSQDKPDIMFAVCAYARHQVTAKECHLHAVKRIFRYLKGHPKLGRWYPKEYPFDLVAYSDSDYDGASQDLKSTTRGCQFFGRRLISWQCKKQTIVATLTTKAEYVVATNLLTKPFDAGRFQYLVDRNNGRGNQDSRYRRQQYNRRARIAQSSALPPVVDKPASPIGDDSQGEACPTNSGLEADQDRANIPKTSTLPSDSTPRVTSLAADEGSMQQKLDELMALYSSLQRKQSEMVSKEGLDEREEVAKRVSDDTKEMEIVLTSMDATRILTSGGVQVVPTVAEVATATVSIPTSSGVVSTASPTIPIAALIFTTATESTPYTRRKGKETMVESKTPKKKKISRDAEIVRIHAKEELHMLIDGLDRNNETVAKYLHEYNQFAAELPIEKRIELISDLVKYQDNYAKVLKYQTQQRKPLTKKEQREFYTSVLRNQHLDREDLNQLWELVKETLSIRPATSDKEMEI